MANKPTLTLWLWLEGAFPRRISYFLLQKGLVSSPAALLRGETNAPDLRIVRMGLDLSAAGGTWTFDPAHDALPAGASTPCLRVRGPHPHPDRWVRESASILAFLDTYYSSSSSPALQPADPVDRAAAADATALVDHALAHARAYLAHAAPAAAAWSGLRAADRSLAAAAHARGDLRRCLRKLAGWTAPALAASGWLTPGVAHGPGLVDVALAGPARYLVLAYAWDILAEEEEEDDDAELLPLRRWYARFCALPWWRELEERADVHPRELRFGEAAREV
ncbi:hypothetical protein F4780DRAFT_776247 [Xylariomycetidae sp. FL0641]|nr:hypothetical protein F4780DRAFT_776247 [Xylariomycetidae sp. FL0641]